MRAKKELTHQSDIELAARVRARNTPIRQKTYDEINAAKQRKKEADKALERLRIAGDQFRDPDTIQQTF